MPPFRRSPYPRLRSSIRLIAYAGAGCAMEAAFTSAVESVGRGRAALRPPATPLMALIYALALPLFEPAHDTLRHRPTWMRASAYAAGILSVEATLGWALRRATGRCPWDYTGRSRFELAGLVRLDYAPLWGLAGLGAERLHDAMTGGCARMRGRGPVAQR